MPIQESVLLYFQETGTPFLDSFFELATMLGEKNILIAVIAWVFWNIDKKKGFILSYTLLFSLVLNAVLKISFHRPRPFEQIPGISGKRVHTATGYAFPSGHTQGATTFYITIALLVRRWWVYAAAVLLSLLVAVSRVYLGVHWPVDVIGALLAGSVVSLGMYYILNTLYDKSKSREFFIILSALGAALALLIFIAINSVYFHGELVMTDLVKTVGVFSGASLGFIIEERMTKFSITGSLLKKILRFIIGLGGTMVLLSGSKLVFPFADPFHFMRYVLVGLWITWLYPAIGKRIGLFV